MNFEQRCAGAWRAMSMDVDGTMRDEPVGPAGAAEVRDATQDALTLEIERRITAAKSTRFHTLLALADAYAETAPDSEERSVARMAFAVQLGRERKA